MRHRWLFYLILLIGLLGIVLPLQAQDDTADFVQRVLDLTNQARADAGLQPLTFNDALITAAQNHAQAMADFDFVAHKDPVTGSVVGDRVTAAGYSWQFVAENIGVGAATPEEVVQDWLVSPGHRDNILSPDATETGIGYFYEEDDEFPSAESPYQIYWVQNFAAPDDQLILVGPTPTLALTPTATLPIAPTVTQFVTMTVSAEPEVVNIDEAVTVKITLSGVSDNCGQSVVVKPVDVILVIDHSGSMKGQPLRQAKDAAAAFVHEMDFANDRVGIVPFSSNAQLSHPLDTDEAVIIQAIENISEGGGTNIHRGLEEAFAHLHSNPRDEATPVIVLLSDGESDQRAAERAAEAAQAAGVKIVTVGLGPSLDEALMQRIASPDTNGNPQYFNSPDGSDLVSIYVAIAQNIREYGLASDLTLRQELGFYQFSVFPESINEGGETTGDTVTWQKELLEDGDTTFTYQVRPREGGVFNITQLTEAIFLECEQTEVVLERGPGPQVTVQGEIGEIPAVPFECDWWQTFPWWLLAPLLLALLLLLFLFLPGGRRWRRKLSQKPLLCKVLTVLTLLYLLFLVTLFAHALQGDLCTADQVYFWRATEDKSGAAVYVTRFGADDGQAVDYLNQGSECVACHAAGVNEEAKQQYVSAVRDNQNGPVVLHTPDGDDVFIPLINASYTAFSPDGRFAALSVEDKDIYILDITTGALTALEGASDPDIIETMPAWSADGRIIAFVRTTATDPLNSAQINAPSDIYTVPIAGGTPLPLVGASDSDEEWFNYYPAYSPDGKWLAFTRHKDGDRSYADDEADIYLVPAEGGERVFLRANSEMSDSWPSWSPDSRWLGFGSNRFNDQFDILLVQINEVGQSSGVFRLPAAATPSEDEFYPVWLSPLQLSWWERLLPLWPWLLPLFLLLALGWFFCRERRYELSGQVTDAMTRQPISGAQIKIGPLSLPAQHSDGNGRYRFQAPLGSATLTTTAPDYNGQTRSADVQGDTTLDFQLYPLIEDIKWLKPPPPLPQWEQQVVWQPIPTLVVGLGGTGRHVLTYLKKNLLDASKGQILADGRVAGDVRLLLLDTSDFELLDGQRVPVSFAGVELAAEEVVEFGDDLSDLVQADAVIEREIRDWFPAADYRTRLGMAELDLSLGTYQRRPPARAAIVRDVRQGEESRLWQALRREAENVLDKDDNRLRVIITGSLAGGFGSAIVADIAYLARRAGSHVGAKGLSIEAYLATNGVFSQIAARPNVHATNTYASLRELERFQLAQGYPFRMTYHHDAAGNDVLAGLIDWRLLDEVYLFDKPPNINPANEAQSQRYNDPAVGIFPAMADAITLWLDKASRSYLQGNQQRREVQATVTNEQRAQGRAVVGGFGAFSYRLPMYDLMMQLEARWVRSLLRQLILGEAEGDLRLDPRLNREVDPNAVHDHVHQFLVGLAGYVEPACPVTTSLAGILAQEGNSLNFQEKLIAMPPGELEDELHNFRNYLAGALVIIMNGVSGGRTAVARGGKIGYALYFLDALEQALSRAMNEADLLPSDVSDELAHSAEQLRQLFPEFRVITNQFARDLRRQASLISFSLREENSEDQETGLYEHCLDVERSYANYLAEMDAILVRRYVHSNDLLKQWQAAYLFNEEADDDALRRLHWAVGESGELQLRLQTWGDQAAALGNDETSQLRFLKALFRLAAHVTQEIWKGESLATVLEQTELHPQQIPQTAFDLQAGSVPLLGYDEFGAPSAMWSVVLGANAGVAQAQTLESALNSQWAAERKLTRLSITDPFALLVSQAVDVIPLGAIPSVTAAEQVYQGQYGLIANVPADPRAEPTAVFRAERIALELEQRLQPELRQLSRLLRPIIVTALDAGGLARLYALAIGAGDWIDWTPASVTIRLPDHITVTIPVSPEELAHPLVKGFVKFAVTASAHDVQALQTAVQNADSNTIEAWRRWTRSNWQTLPLVQELQAAGADGTDLAVVVILVARDEVKRRQQQRT